MSDTDKEIIAVLLKSVFDRGLISETTYRSSLNRLRTIDEAPFDTYSGTQHETKECLANGYTES